MKANEPSLSDLLQRLAVWMKGYAIPGEDPAAWRKDSFGNRIRWDDYGDRLSNYGWEIDHIHPKSLGGSDDISNLRPLHCKQNASLGGGLGQILLSGGLFPGRK